MELLIFIVVAGLSILSALMVIVQRNPVYSALSLIATLFLVAVVFLLLDAPFVAVLQLIVYAGAIMVLFLFVIMLLSVREQKKGRIYHQLLVAVPVVLLVCLELLAAGKIVTRGQSLSAGCGSESIEVLSTKLITQYFLPFEIASVLLLAAIVGAVVVVKKEGS
ncbi:MAG: NADH-quinone oxidoreductase subunit J [Candidatus Eisenbacteria bacterium]|nr:NADH-quinone oxidoreductase subunit J [Candidatus Eisenbacteria bacterium]